MVTSSTLMLLCVAGRTFATWQSLSFNKVTVIDYVVQEEHNVSPIVCANYCLNKPVCQGMVYEDSNCKLITDVINGPGGSKEVFLHGQIRGKIVKMIVQTSDIPDAGPVAAVKTDLCGEDNQCCHMADFNHPGADLRQSQTDVYENGFLLGCEKFPLHGFKSYKLQHVGSNAWRGEWIKIFFQDDSHYYCEITDLLDGNYLNLDCEFIPNLAPAGGPVAGVPSI